MWFSCRVAIDAMKGFLERAGSKDLLEALNESGVWAMISDEMQYPQAITMLAKYMNAAIHFSGSDL